jgi:hypothetical protein
MAITETWLKPGDQDKITIGDLTPKGYKLKHIPRPSGRGGGVAILHKEGIRLSLQTKQDYASFEYMEAVLTPGSTNINIIVIYRPPPSTQNRLTVGMFFSDFADYLEELMLVPGDLLLLGDFNFHVDEPSDAATMQFNDLLSSFGLVQHVVGSTHKDGHTLDLLITRASDTSLANWQVNNPLISDHYLIQFELNAAKPVPCRQKISYRKLKSIDKAAFQADLLKSELLTTPADSVTDIVEQYNIVFLQNFWINMPLFAPERLPLGQSPHGTMMKYWKLRKLSGKQSEPGGNLG